MASADTVEVLIDSIYATALQPDTCGELVGSVGRKLGATSGASLWFGSGGSEILHAHSWNVDPEALSTYEQHYLPVCPRLKATRDLDVGTVYDDRAMRNENDPRLRDYYAFMDRHDLGLARMVLAEKRPGLIIGMNFYNRTTDGLPEEGEQLLGLLSPHFRRACNLAQALGDVFERAALGDAWLEARTASLTLDRTGLVVRLNAQAESVLREGDGLRLIRRRLVTGMTKDQDLLRAEIASALTLTSPARAASAGTFVLISRPSGKPPYAVSVVRLPRSIGRERAIVTIAQSVPQVAPQVLQHAFGLTRSEASITAALTEGKSPEDIAEARGVSLQTIRSQMKTIYRRLDVGSQAELVSRVTAAALGVQL